MRAILLTRYNALSAYCRNPKHFLYSEEVAWFSGIDERVLGAIIRDRFDNDFGGVILGRDKRNRYR